jgi:hypothetical protein
LTKKLAEIRKDKKEAAADYRERLSEVEEEIEAIIAEQDAQNTKGTNP